MTTISEGLEHTEEIKRRIRALPKAARERWSTSIPFAIDSELSSDPDFVAQKAVIVNAVPDIEHLLDQIRSYELAISAFITVTEGIAEIVDGYPEPYQLPLDDLLMRVGLLHMFHKPYIKKDW